MEWIFVKMLLSLGAVLGLMFGLVYLLKRFVLARPGQSGAGISIDVLGRKMLQPKKSVVILRVAGKVLVIGLSDQGMHTLAELPDDSPAADQDERSSAVLQKTGTFAAQLQSTVQALVGRPYGKVKL